MPSEEKNWLPFKELVAEYRASRKEESGRSRRGPDFKEDDYDPCSGDDADCYCDWTKTKSKQTCSVCFKNIIKKVIKWIKKNYKK